DRGVRRRRQRSRVAYVAGDTRWRVVAVARHGRRAARLPSSSGVIPSRGRARTRGRGTSSRRGVSSLAVNGVEDDLDRIAGWLVNARYVTVLTGAGISTDSGIPDFRGPNGVWTKNPDAEKTATLQYYMSDPEIRRRAWQNRINSGMWSAAPN